MAKLIRQRMRSFAVLGALVVVVLGVGVSQVLAKGTGTAPIQKHNSSCGADVDKKAIGSVTFTRIDKTTLRTAVRIDRGVPSNQYTIYLYDGHCNQLTKLGKFKTGSDGDGNRTFTSSRFGHQSFFVDAYDGTDDNDSVIVKVAG
jgi:hypothetical protein